MQLASLRSSANAMKVTLPGIFLENVARAQTGGLRTAGLTR
jgi:hypothetical protein